MIYFDWDVIYDPNIDQAFERLEQILMNDFFKEEVDCVEEVNWMKEGF